MIQVVGFLYYWWCALNMESLDFDLYIFHKVSEHSPKIPKSQAMKILQKENFACGRMSSLKIQITTVLWN